jgi:UDP-N-acetylmuramyl pentapeptide phosphotransferase/UDP-N-acetylglucosamine-1-phosphate transferase
MTINEPSTVHEAPAEWVHRLSLRLLLLAAALLVVGVGFLLWNSWDLTGGRKGSTLA